jgi:hypothetical protein
MNADTAKLLYMCDVEELCSFTGRSAWIGSATDPRRSAFLQLPSAERRAPRLV